MASLGCAVADPKHTSQNLIDLAGSESATGQDDRRKEGAFINKRYALRPRFSCAPSHSAFSQSPHSGHGHWETDGEQDVSSLVTVILPTETLTFICFLSASGHIPYRDSKLTRLLQPALSGNSRVAVICTISPDPEQATETLSTLKFAKRAKMVVTKAERGIVRYLSRLGLPCDAVADLLSHATSW